MKILFLSWENFCTEGMAAAFRKLGHEVIFLDTNQEELLCPRIGERLGRAAAETGADLLFGFNYFPEAAKKAADIGLDYYSWVYDNPCVQLYSHTVLLPTNHIFVFDSDTYFRFHSQGIENIRFLPMAASPVPDAGCLATGRFHNDIAFIGTLYSESHNFYERMMKKGIPDRTSGYIRGVMESQKILYGTNLTEDLLTDRVIDEMHKALPLEPGADSVITKRTLFAEYVINRQITAEERSDLLSMLGDRFGNIALYTADRNVRIPGIINKGKADPYKEAPAIYNSTRINLNISLRSIVNGIPLRCFEIMGSAGFLMSSYAGDFSAFFVDGQDYVSFDSPEALADRCAYFLLHEDERNEIAGNGWKKIKSAHTFVHRAAEMLA